MKKYPESRLFLSITMFCLFAAACLMPITSLRQAAAQNAADSILHAPEASKMLPPSVYFRGQSAPIQGRNSAGVKYADANFTFATLVDNSGYSTAIAAKYQGYLLTEVPLDVAGQALQPGAYGFGFIADNKFVIQDIGAHDLLTATSTRDEQLRPAVPLQIKADSAAGKYRLYAGRNYIVFSRK
jgi:hypothetical protein